MLERLIPQNIEAEQNVLSAMMIDPKAVDTASEILKPEDFYRIAHQIVADKAVRRQMALYTPEYCRHRILLFGEIDDVNNENGDMIYEEVCPELAIIDRK